MPNIEKALTEWRRVLRHHGKLLVATNSRYSRPKIAGLKALAGERLRAEVPRSFSECFDLENGSTQLQHVFGNTRLYEFETELRVPEANPCLEVLKSVRDAFDPSPSEQAWGQTIAEIKTIIGDEISSVGYFSDTVKAGFFLACKEGNCSI